MSDDAGVETAHAPADALTEAVADVVADMVAAARLRRLLSAAGA
ncbi:hypothetical protein GA0115240_11121, partial [Streptomyces sp. DvalAA-14]